MKSQQHDPIYSQISQVKDAVAEVLEVGGGGSQYPVALMWVPQWNRHRPSHAWVAGNILIGRPTDIVGGGSHPEYRVQQKVETTGFSSHDEINTRHGAGEAISRLVANMLYAQQHKYRHTDCHQSHDDWPFAIQETLYG